MGQYQTGRHRLTKPTYQRPDTRNRDSENGLAQIDGWTERWVAQREARNGAQGGKVQHLSKREKVGDRLQS